MFCLPISRSTFVGRHEDILNDIYAREKKHLYYNGTTALFSQETIFESH